jgi:hypothetical protein
MSRTNNAQGLFDSVSAYQKAIEHLVGSIRDSGFWDNVLVRPSPLQPRRYELAYGHTRIEAVRRVGITEVDLPVRDISDEEMLSIMIHENATVYGHGTQTNNHAVAQACRYLARELLKAEALGGWQWILAGEISRLNKLRDVLETRASYRNAIDELLGGCLPGHVVVTRFLARHGNALSEHEIRSALAALKGTDVGDALAAEAAA